MTNTIYNITTQTSFGEYIIADIFNKSITLNESSVSAYDSWFDYIDVNNSDRLDSLAYRIYNNTNVWDVLFVINSMNTVFDLPKSDDYLYKLSEEALSKWMRIFPDTSSERQKELLDGYFKENEAINEKYRRLKIIKPQYLSRFTELLNVQ